jgi:hypothetical protein
VEKPWGFGTGSRDLFMLDMSFLVIKKIVDRFPFGTLIIFLFLWIANINIYFISTMALLFFSLGYYIAKYELKEESIDKINLFDILAIYTATIYIELFLYEYLSIIHSINTLIGCVLLIKLSKHIIENKRLYAFSERLEKYAFFVFAIHLPYSNILRKVMLKFFPSSNMWTVIFIQYFGLVIFEIMLFLGIGVVIKKKIPKIFALLTGGRHQS